MLAYIIRWMFYVALCLAVALVMLPRIFSTKRSAFLLSVKNRQPPLYDQQPDIIYCTGILPGSLFIGYVPDTSNGY